jgi:hypothetical protein
MYAPNNEDVCENILRGKREYRFCENEKFTLKQEK